MRKWLISGFIYFVIISLVGVLLRLKMVTSVLPELPFIFLLHAHSHGALLGWVFFILTAFLIQFTMPSSIWNNKRLQVLFYLLHISVIGMLVSFSLQGYSTFSITFSTFHILLSYYFAYLYFSNQSQPLPPPVKHFFHTGVVLNLVSSSGPWGLAIMGMMGKSEPDIFNLFIYFYLHFQYNGWFTFIILGLAYALMEQNSQPYSTLWAKSQFYILLISILPTYLPSILWFPMPRFLEFVGILGAILQFVAMIMFITMIKPLIQIETNKWLKLFLILSIWSLGLKSILEMIGSWPTIAYLIYTNRQVIIAYLHLTLLGSVSSFLLYATLKKVRIRKQYSKLLAVSSNLYIIGTVSMVLFLFLAGLVQWLAIPVISWIWTILLITSIIIGLGLIGLALIIR